ncbi:MAG: hypothetical protein RLZZ519_357 [Bacteroidota bacterium]
MIASFGRFLLGTALFVGLAHTTMVAQTVSASSVPANTVKAFQASSGGAAATWMAGPNRSHEATFVKEGQKMVYVYDQESQLQQKKIVSTVGAFPAGVNAAVKAAYPTGNVEYAYKVVNRTNQKFYEVQVANAAGVERMRFDLEGKPLGKTSLAASQPAGAQPVATQPVAVKQPSPAPQPAVVATKPATPAVATQPAPAKPVSQPSPAVTKPVAAAQPATPKPSQPMAMRGESATTKTTTVVKDDLLDDDMDDLLEDDGDMDDMFKEDDSWDDIDLGDDFEDDSDLLEGGDDLDDDLELDDDIDDDDL